MLVKLLLCWQDATGFTPLMRLLQRGAWADASELLGRGDCNINAQVDSNLLSDSTTGCPPCAQHSTHGTALSIYACKLPHSAE